MKNFCLITLSVVLVFLGAQVSLGCICPVKAPPCYAHAEYDTIFAGTVKKVGNEMENFPAKVEIDVEQNFKGMDRKTAFTYNYSTSCHYRFAEGDKFLFYGTLNEKDKSVFSTGYCTLTKRIAEKKPDDLEFLSSLNDPTPSYLISGYVGYETYSSPQGVKAQIFDDKKKLAAVSDNEGNFKIPVSRAGVYKLVVSMPERTSWDPGPLINSPYWEYFRKQIKDYDGDDKPATFIEYQIDVKANRCGWFYLPLRKNG